MKHLKMNHTSFTKLGKVSALPILIALFLLTSTIVYAQTGGNYDLVWGTVNGGGVTNQAGANDYSLGGTIGQPNAAIWSNGHYTLSGGFWGGGSLMEHHIYLPLVLKW